MSSQETLIAIINDAPLSTTTKGFFVKKVEREGATRENITALRELLRTVQHNAFANTGLELDVEDPKLKAAQEKLTQDLKAAADVYTATMNRLEKQAERLAKDIQEDLKHLETIVLKSAAAEA